MNTPDYEYRGLMAATWDLFRGDTSGWGDKVFYRDVIDRYGEPVLDVGCATGRLILDYLADGVDVDGVDFSPEMLAICRGKAGERGLTPNLYEQSMESLDLPRAYRTIVVSSSSFQLVTDVDAATRAMQRFHAHLESSGALVMPFMTLWQEGDPTQDDWKLTAEKIREEDVAVVRRWSRSRYDVEQQLEHTEDRYEVTLEGEVIDTEFHQRSPATRSYTQQQAADLYEKAGFADIRILSGFTWNPASASDTLFSVLGTRP